MTLHQIAGAGKDWCTTACPKVEHGFPEGVPTRKRQRHQNRAWPDPSYPSYPHEEKMGTDYSSTQFRFDLCEFCARVVCPIFSSFLLCFSLRQQHHLSTGKEADAFVSWPPDAIGTFRLI